MVLCFFVLGSELENKVQKLRLEGLDAPPASAPAPPTQVNVVKVKSLKQLCLDVLRTANKEPDPNASSTSTPRKKRKLGTRSESGSPLSSPNLRRSTRTSSPPVVLQYFGEMSK